MSLVECQQKHLTQEASHGVMSQGTNGIPVKSHSFVSAIAFSIPMIQPSEVQEN